MPDAPAHPTLTCAIHRTLANAPASVLPDQAPWQVHVYSGPDGYALLDLGHVLLATDAPGPPSPLVVVVDPADLPRTPSDDTRHDGTSVDT